MAHRTKILASIASVVCAVLLSAAGGCSLNAPVTGSSAHTPLKSDWIRTEMFFGLTESGAVIPDQQWHDFIDQSITPRFPDGLTIEYGSGQYRANNNQLHKEPTAILILLHARENYRRDDVLLNSIAQDYDSRFHQESVLRCDSDAQVNFIAAPPATGK